MTDPKHAERESADRKRTLLIAAGAGIGSAALVAALLYAGRTREEKHCVPAAPPCDATD